MVIENIRSVALKRPYTLTLDNDKHIEAVHTAMFCENIILHIKNQEIIKYGM